MVLLKQPSAHPVQANNLVDETPAKPNNSNTVAEIKAWLDEHNVSYQSNAVKAELLELVNDTDV